jgi:hypothetical protein
MNKKLCFRIAGFLILTVGVLSCAGLNERSSLPDAILAESPANSSYLIDNERIELENGLKEWQAAPGSSSRIKVAIAGDPVYGDLTSNSMVDAALFTIYQGGGSGTFYYIGAALSEKGQYRGLNTILIGDRIKSPVAKIQNGLITVSYFDRRPDEAMSAVPTLAETRYFIVKESSLQEIKVAADEAVFQGWLTIGHEVRSFLPCDENDNLWLLGNSSALQPITVAYEKAVAGLPPYTPVFCIITGRRTAAPEEGYGADYQEAFFATTLVHIWPKGNCRSDLIIVDAPLPGAQISSPLEFKGKARGIWFFEGDFPVILLDAQGNRIAEGYASAKGEWMTKNFVNFEGILHFRESFSGMRGSLVLKKDNPTGLPRFDDALEIPINFK